MTYLEVCTFIDQLSDWGKE